jgi:hypothetical protein
MNLMNKDYRYSHLILDAQLFLVKNWMVLKNKPYYSDQALFTSFFQSVVKLLREEVSADNVILVWDKTPYHKVTLLEDYKGDRDYRGEGDITDDMTEEMKEELRKRTQQFESRQRVKYKLVYESYKFGMPSIVLGGYEADDFAFLASRSDLAKNSENKILVVSKDQDYRYFVNENTDFYSFTKTRYYLDLETIKNEVGDLDPYAYKSIFDSLFGSHNYLKNTKHPDSNHTISEIREMIKSNDYSFSSDPDLFNRQLNSFRVWEYPDYNKALWMINNIPLKSEYMDSTTFNQYTLDSGLNINFNYYNNFLKSINKS